MSSFRTSSSVIRRGPTPATHTSSFCKSATTPLVFSCRFAAPTPNSNTAADPAFNVFSSRLLAAPHRDVTQVPYGDWFTLYVGLRKTWNAALQKPANASTSESNPQLHHQQQQQTKLSIDAALWSSLFARHWSEVQVRPDQSDSQYRWWWHATSALDTSSLSTTPAQDQVAASTELCTSDFLTEPLLGGRYLRLWMEDIRASATSSAAPSPGNPTSDAHTVLLPFSALWEVKQSAYWRPSSISTNAAPPAGAARKVLPSLSLQERQARQALLQSIDQLLQLQCDAPKAAPQLQRVRVLSPTQEWNLLCQAVQFRQALFHPVVPSASTLKPSSSPSASTASPLPPPWLSIGSLCVDSSARLAYYAHLLHWRQQQHGKRNIVQPELDLAAVRVLSPSSEHARLRRYGLAAVHEHSSLKAALDRRHAARQQSTSTAATTSGSAASAATVHGQARKGCSDAVRRMSNREENIRQSFSVR